MAMKMRPLQPDCIVLAVYEQGDRLVVLGKVRKLDGSMLNEPVISEPGTEPYALLREGLEQAADLAVKHCAVFTNSRDLVEFFTPPISVPQPDTQTVRVGKNEYVEIPAGGDPNQWAMFRLLLGYRKFRVWAIGSEKMKGATDEWRRYWSK